MKRTARMALLALGTALLAGALIIARPAAHLLWVAWRDRGSPATAPAGWIDDASWLNATEVLEVVEVAGDALKAEQQLAALLARATAQRLSVSIAGARHTMGGHTIAPHGIVIDMRPFDQLELDPVTNMLHVQAGARWEQVIPFLDQRGRSIEVMQSNNSFTVGGSLSANCHGWQPNRPPIASTVEAFRLMKADGTIVRCSRRENAELFSMALGGYGLFGIILDVDLRTVPNERYRYERILMPASDLAAGFQERVCGRADVGMAYGRVSVARGAFLTEASLNVFQRDACAPELIPALDEPSLTAIRRSVFRGSADSDYGKRLRWEAENLLAQRLAGRFVSRNQLLNESVEWYADHSADHTDILHEYFVPPEQLSGLLADMRRLIPASGLDLLNVTVRHVQADSDSFLRYADRELLAVVLLFNQPRSAEADQRMQSLTQELIAASLSRGGRYYLPYRLHATVEQFHAAYPQAPAFFQAKRRHDPHALFQTYFLRQYDAGCEQ